MPHKRVGMLTTFCETRSGYSLITVAETQIRMLLDHYYDPVVLTQEGERWQDSKGNWHFKPFEEQGLWDRRKIDLRPVVPWRAISYRDDFEGAVDATYLALKENLADVGVCITHDIILQEWYVAHNIAMQRYAATRPDLTWLHWIHSCPMPRGRFVPSSTTLHDPGPGPTPVTPERARWARYSAPPGYIVYPNATDISFPARTYHLEEQEWRIKVHRHTLDPLARAQSMTKALVTASDFLNADIRCIYPARLDRGKQPELIIDLLAGCQAHGRTAKLLVCDWQSAGERFQRYIDELSEYAAHKGVPVSFASRLDDRCNQGVPHDVVMELFGLSNIYVHPSRVETYSLTVHEAMSTACLCVLNDDFPTMRELFGKAAIYMPFGSDRFHRAKKPDEYWVGEAETLLDELGRNRVLSARDAALREWTPQRAWPEFESLLNLEPVAGEGKW